MLTSMEKCRILRSYSMGKSTLCDFPPKSCAKEMSIFPMTQYCKAKFTPVVKADGDARKIICDNYVSLRTEQKEMGDKRDS
eukprot:gene22770-9194_t